MATQAPVPITSTPQAGQLIEHNGNNYDTIREGQAYILIPPNTKLSVDPNAKAKTDDGSVNQKVFYNPIQQFNRDLSVLAIKAFSDDWLERRNLKRERSKEKAEKKNKKRKIAQANGDAVDKDGSPKLQKAEDGTGVPTTGSVEELQTEDGAEAGTAPALVSKDMNTGGAESKENEVQDANKDNQAEHETSDHAKLPQGPSFRILDALSASGLRALRYAKEVPNVTAIVANDMSPNAIKSMKLNIEHNKLSSYITANTGDAIGHMYSVAYPPTHSHGPQHVSKKYDVIDLDPYGTAVPFLDAAIQSLNDGGLLCVTCTDSGVFASTGYCEKTYSLYGGMPVKGPHMHEGGLRLILHSIASAASKYGIAIEPLLSLNIDFYARVFVRIRKSPADVKFLAGKTMVVYGCDSGCGSWTTNMLGRNTKQDGKGGNVWFKHTIAQAPSADRCCEHCGSKTHVAGPMWGGPIHNAAFIDKILDDLESVDPNVYQTTQRIEGMLNTARDELRVDQEVTTYTPVKDSPEGSIAEMIPKTPPEVVDRHPFFFNASAVSKVIHCIAPSDLQIRGAIRHLGYRAVRSHCQPGSIKTNAPWDVLWEIMREWVRQKQPIREGALKETTAGFRIMQKARKVEESKEDGVAASETGQDTPERNGATAVPEKSAEPKRVNVVFDEVLGKDKAGPKRLVRYQVNPRENWGPMTKAKGSG